MLHLWEHTISDIITLHDYEEYGEQMIGRYQDKEPMLNNKILFNKHKYAFAKGCQYKGQPIIISEYGGIAFCTNNGWSYGELVKDEAAFLKRFKSLTTTIKALDYVVGFCYHR
ncbi:MAG: glycoside hydrolase family 2 [Clostridiales bacterium]|jgi:hypothetical protein|nr:glycoside hydrolase family 2 [Clostridiales bacterium]